MASSVGTSDVSLELPFVPLCEPAIAGNEWTYVKECLDTGWVSSVGAFVDRFERALADTVGVPHAVATVNGTAALHAALLVAGVQPGDEVLVSSLTFIAPANAIRYVGAYPVFVDAEPNTWQMDTHRVVEYLTRDCRWSDGALFSKLSGRRVGALLPVHILGHPVDVDPLLEVAQRYGIPVIEDATESLGAQYRGRRVGALGDIACFSFNGNKLVTTGGGGMLVTANEAWARRARYLTTQAKDDPIEYVHGAIGFNYRLTNVLAAIGVAQMERLESMIRAKRQIARCYAAALQDIDGIRLMAEAPWAESVFWMYTVLVDPDRFGCDARGLLQQLARQRIQTRPLWQPLHRSPAHAGAVVLGGETADRVYRDALSLPCSVSLGPASQARVSAAIGAARCGPTTHE